MLKHIKNLLEHNSLIIAVSITLLIAYLSLRTLQIEIPLKITFFDKILHITAYFVLSTCWLFHFRENRKSQYIAIVFVFLYGVLLEFMQGWFNPNRTKDVYDVLANSTGILISFILFKFFLTVYKKIFVNYN